MQRKRLIKYLMFFVCIISSACANMQELANMPNDELIAHGDAEMKDENYTKAITYYKSVILNSENPTNAQYAQKMMGNAYFEDEKYIDAIAAYEVYNDLYRRTPDSAFIIFHIGLAYTKSSFKSARDQTFTKKAVDYFDELHTLYPSDYIKLGAGDYHISMKNKLAEHEYQVAKYYSKLKISESALSRIKYLMENYPESPDIEDAYILRVVTTLQIDGQAQTALAHLEDLKSHYPNNGDIKSLTKSVNKKIIKETKQ